MHVHFIITGNQAVPIINSYWAMIKKKGLKAERVILFYHQRNLQIAEKLKKIILTINKEYGVSSEVSIVLVPEDEIPKMKEVLGREIQEYQSKKATCSFNITGGSKLLALALIQTINEIEELQVDAIYYLFLKNRNYFNILYSLIPPEFQDLVVMGKGLT